jgi:RNA polymerase sigma-70 factor (ECF subfamily)
VCNIAGNLAIDYYRRAARMEPGDFESARRFPDPPRQLDDLLRREEARLARKVLAGMETARYREVLYRFYIAEESKEHICARLRLSALHFNRILYRAKERYRVLYQEALNSDAGKGRKRQNKD